MIFVSLIMLAIPIVIVFALVRYFSSRSRSSQLAQPPQSPKTIQDRLFELDGLRYQNLISEAEYEEKRRHIVSSI